MNNDTARDAVAINERLALFPSALSHLSDPEWCHAIAGYIAADLPYMSEDDRQDIFARLAEARVRAHVRRAA